MSWKFSERVHLFLSLQADMSGLRIGRTGIDLSSSFHVESGKPWTGELAEIDTDDFRSFVLAWRQFVTRSEPVHVRTLLKLTQTHVPHPKLQESAGVLADRLDMLNRNDVDDLESLGYRLAFSYGGREYSPWDVADLIMHGQMFHTRDRAKAAVLTGIDPGTRLLLEQEFRRYIAETRVIIDLTAVVLQKAADRGWINDQPVGIAEDSSDAAPPSRQSGEGD